MKEEGTEMIQQLKRDLLICCGGLYDADLVDGKIILRCIRCGAFWQRQPDGTFRSVAIRKKNHNGMHIMGHHCDSETQRN